MSEKYNSGQVKFGTPGSQTNLSLSNASRRLYDFSDRVADLSPEESPFFVYLNNDSFSLEHFQNNYNLHNLNSSLA